MLILHNSNRSFNLTIFL